MVNVKAAIYAALSASCIGAAISDEYPKEWKTFPKVTFTEAFGLTAGTTFPLPK